MISNVFINETIYMQNTLHFKGSVSLKKFDALFDKMLLLINEKKAKNTGAFVTIVNNLVKKNRETIIDIELFIPLDREIRVTNEFKFIRVFELKNALKIKIDGDFEECTQATVILKDYINSNCLQPTTPMLVKTIISDNTILKNNEMINEIYIGIK